MEKNNIENNNQNQNWYDNLANLTDFVNFLVQSGLIKNIEEIDDVFKNPEKFNEPFYFYKNEILGEEINLTDSSKKNDYDSYQNLLDILGIGKIVIVEIDDVSKLNSELDLILSIDDVKNIKMFLLRNILLLKKHGEL